MDSTELISMIGFPARALGRLPLIARYVVGRNASLDASHAYCLERFGSSYRLRPWLMFDAGELRLIEVLINEGSNEEILAFRTAQLASGASTTVVGSLLASACVTMLSLDSLSQVNLTVRGLITISLMLSLIAVYFALVQQRELLLGSNADGLRKWLWSGRTRALPPSTRSRSHLPSPSHPKGSDPRTLGDRKVRESSLAANIVLQAPYELLGIAISVFLGALTAYLGLAMAQHVELGTGTLPGNTGVFVAFVICTVFTLCVFGQSLGQKDREMARCAGDGEEVSQERAA